MTDCAVDRHGAYVERSLGARRLFPSLHAAWSVRARRPLLQRAVAQAKACLDRQR
jgi:AmiR/NasT family two-component response regulator